MKAGFTLTGANSVHEVVAGDFDGDGATDLAFGRLATLGGASNWAVTVVSDIASAAGALDDLPLARKVTLVGPDRYGLIDDSGFVSAAFVTVPGDTADQLLVGSPQAGANGNAFADGRIDILSYGQTASGEIVFSGAVTVIDNDASADALDISADPSGLGASGTYLGDWYDDGSRIAFVGAPDDVELSDSFTDQTGISGYYAGMGAYVDIDTGEVRNQIIIREEEEGFFGFSSAASANGNLLAVGMPQSELGLESPRGTPGQVFIYQQGAPTGDGRGTFSARIEGDSFFDSELGWNVAFVGDLNWQEQDTLAMYAPRTQVNSDLDGVVYLAHDVASLTGVTRLPDVVPGRPLEEGGIDAALYGFESSDVDDVTLHRLGDVTGDGIDDFAIAARNETLGGSTSGVVYIVAGNDVTGLIDIRTLGSDGGAAGYRLFGSEGLGQGVTALGDVNGDGLGDFAIAAKGATNAAGDEVGGVHVIYGGSYLKALDALDGSDGVIDVRRLDETVDISGYPANRAPDDRNLEFPVRDTGFTVNIDLSASDPDGDRIRIIEPIAVRGIDVDVNDTRDGIIATIPAGPFTSLNFDVAYEDPNGLIGTANILLVNDVNSPPVFDIPDIFLPHGENALFQIPRNDIDGDTVWITDVRIDLVAFNGGFLPVTSIRSTPDMEQQTVRVLAPDPNLVRTVEVLIDVADSAGNTATLSTNVVWTNAAPVALTEPRFEGPAGDIVQIPLDQLFFDPEGRALGYSVPSSSDNASVTFAPDVSFIGVSYVGDPFVGTVEARASVTATDGPGETTLNVVAVDFTNTAPALRDDIPGVFMMRPDGITLQATDLFEDPDLGGRDLRFVPVLGALDPYFISGDRQLITFGVDDPSTFGVGSTTFGYTVAVADGIGIETTDTVFVRYENAAPTAGPDGLIELDLATRDTLVGVQLSSLELRGLVDPDGDAMTLVDVEVADGPGRAQITGQGGILAIGYTSPADNGSVTVTYDVTVGDVYGAETTIPFTVNYINEAPQLIDPEPEIALLTRTFDVDVRDLFTDREGDAVTLINAVRPIDPQNIDPFPPYSIDFDPSNPTVFTVTLRNSVFNPDRFAEGYDMAVRLTVEDTAGSVNVETFDITLTNEAPVSLNGQDAVATKGVWHVVPLADIAVDPDSGTADGLTISDVTFSRTDYRDVQLNNDATELSVILLDAARPDAVIDMVVTDPFGARTDVSYQLASFGPVNLPAESTVLQKPFAFIAEGGTITLAADDIATDPEGERLQFIDTSVTGNAFTVRQNSLGPTVRTDTIEITSTGPATGGINFVATVIDSVGAVTEIPLTFGIVDPAVIEGVIAANETIERHDLDVGDILTGSLSELDGDTVDGFGESNSLIYEDVAFTRTDLEVTLGSAILDVDDDGDGQSDATTTLTGDFTGGDFMAVGIDAGTQVTFDRFLPGDLAEGVAQDTAAVNGIVNSDFLVGDGATDFQLTLRDLGFAGYHNVLGVYQVADSGSIFDVRIVFENTKSALAVAESVPSAARAMINDIDAGRELGFFLVQDAADWAAGLSGNENFEFRTANGQDGDAFGSEALYLHVNGIAADVNSFHALGADLNFDGVAHALSGVDVGGETMTIGFEDLTGGGDHDYEDVAFQIARIDIFDFG